VRLRKLGRYLKDNLDAIIPATIFSFIISIYFWPPEYIRGIRSDILCAVTGPILTLLGLLIAYRVNDKLRNPKLKIVRWGIYKFEKSIRVFAEIENAAGREIARDAKALITIRRMRDGREESLEKDDLVPEKELIDNDNPLVPYDSVRVEGEPVPWMIPEVPYQSRGLHGLPLKHITNIAPGQRGRVALLDVLKSGEKYYLRVFSEYGTEKEPIEVYTGRPYESLGRYYTRRIRCALKPGDYILYLVVSASKAQPVIGTMRIDAKEEKIVFLEPPQGEADLRSYFEKNN